MSANLGKKSEIHSYKTKNVSIRRVLKTTFAFTHEKMRLQILRFTTSLHIYFRYILSADERISP